MFIKFFVTCLVEYNFMNRIWGCSWVPVIIGTIRLKGCISNLWSISYHFCSGSSFYLFILLLLLRRVALGKGYIPVAPVFLLPFHSQEVTITTLFCLCFIQREITPFLTSPNSVRCHLSIVSWKWNWHSKIAWDLVLISPKSYADHFFVFYKIMCSSRKHKHKIILQLFPVLLFYF